MLTIGDVAARNCQGISRRELLQVGGLGILGVTLADRLRSEEASTSVRQAAKQRSETQPSETACIFIYLEGGPSQLETFDPKPSAPSDVRGPYGTIATNVVGTQICELLPMMA